MDLWNSETKQTDFRLYNLTVLVFVIEQKKNSDTC